MHLASVGAGFGNPEVGSYPPFPLPHPPSPASEGIMSREFCRYTATINDISCEHCCKIAARHYTTSVVCLKFFKGFIV